MRIAALACVLLAGCGFALAPGYFGPDRIPTDATLRRHQYHCFSVKPPTGKGWYVVVSEQTPEETVYRLELPTRTHTLLASAYLVPLDPSLPFEEAAVPHGLGDPDRFEYLERTHDVDASRDVPCVRYSLRLLDKRAPNSPSAPLHMIDRGMVCAHPSIPDTAVRASFSERGLPEELDESLWTELETFLRGVELESEPANPCRLPMRFS